MAGAREDMIEAVVSAATLLLEGIGRGVHRLVRGRGEPPVPAGLAAGLGLLVVAVVVSLAVLAARA